MKLLSKFFRLPRPERHLLVNAAFLLALIRAGLAVLTFDDLRARIDRAAKPTEGPTPPDEVTVERVVWAVTVAARYLPLSLACLPQALAAHVLLGRRGHPSEIRFGVAKDPAGSLEAHAWVECEGRVVIGGAGLERYTPLMDPQRNSV